MKKKRKKSISAFFRGSAEIVPKSKKKAKKKPLLKNKVVKTYSAFRARSKKGRTKKQKQNKKKAAMDKRTERHAGVMFG